MLPTSYRGKGTPTRDDDDLKKRRGLLSSPLLSSLPLPLRRLINDPALIIQHHKPHLAAFIFLLLILILILKPSHDPRVPKALPKTGKEPANWGDYVAMGLARKKLLEQSPKGYADLGDRIKGYSNVGSGGVLYQKRELIGVTTSSENRATSTTTGGEGGQEDRFGRDRHGVLGGSSTSWSSGIVGSGTWLGEQVDMMKDSLVIASTLDEDSTSAPSSSPGFSALTDQIYNKGWVYLDEEDKVNTAKLLAKAKAEGTMDKLPLRDRIRGDEEKMKEAAGNWAKIYSGMEGEGVKSALEVAVEKTVRRVPIVVFSKTTCPHSARAKDLLTKLQLTPSPHVIEVDLRPDGTTLKALLKRRTGHSTFPNIIIGSRSIGGADDFDLLTRDKVAFKTLLEELGVTAKGIV